MAVVRTATDALAGQATLEVESGDRRYQIRYQPPLQSIGGTDRFFLNMRPCPEHSSALRDPAYGIPRL